MLFTSQMQIKESLKDCLRLGGRYGDRLGRGSASQVRVLGSLLPPFLPALRQQVMAQATHLGDQDVFHLSRPWLEMNQCWENLSVSLLLFCPAFQIKINTDQKKAEGDESGLDTGFPKTSHENRKNCTHLMRHCHAGGGRSWGAFQDVFLPKLWLTFSNLSQQADVGIIWSSECQQAKSPPNPLQNSLQRS